MSEPSNPFREKIRTSFELAEKYSWIFYLIILVLLVPFRLGFIEAKEQIIDVIISISLISIAAQCVNKIRHRNNESKPYIICLKCNSKIESTGIWKCRNIIEGKECGWTATFPEK